MHGPHLSSRSRTLVRNHSLSMSLVLSAASRIWVRCAPVILLSGTTRMSRSFPLAEVRSTATRDLMFGAMRSLSAWRYNRHELLVEHHMQDAM